MPYKELLCGLIFAVAFVWGAAHVSAVSMSERVVKLYDVELNDPLFYSPHLNVEGWQSTLQTLMQKRADFFASMRLYPPQDQKERVILTELLNDPNALYPFDFLEQMPNVAKAHDAFIAAPSEETADVLLQEEERAADLYSRDAAELSRISSDAAQLFPYSVYLAIGSAMTLRTIKDDTALIAQNGITLQKEAARRKNCLLFGDCTLVQAPHLLISHPEIPPLPYKVPIDLITPPHTLFTLGPYSTETSCFGTDNGKPLVWPFYVMIGMYQGQLEALPVLANENFYWDVRKSSYTSEKERAALGITYDDQIATNFYMCNDNTYYPDVLTQMFLAETPVEPQERQAIEENKLVNYELMLGKMAELFDGYTDFTLINETPFPVATLLGLRSNYSLTYLPFARSVWRIPLHPQFILNDQAYPNSGRYLTYDQALQKGIDVAKAHVYDTDVLAYILKHLGKENWKDTMTGDLLALPAFGEEASALPRAKR